MEITNANQDFSLLFGLRKMFLQKEKLLCFQMNFENDPKYKRSILCHFYSVAFCTIDATKTLKDSFWKEKKVAQFIVHGRMFSVVRIKNDDSFRGWNRDRNFNRLPLLPRRRRRACNYGFRRLLYHSVQYCEWISLSYFWKIKSIWQ